MDFQSILKKNITLSDGRRNYVLLKNDYFLSNDPALLKFLGCAVLQHGRIYLSDLPSDTVSNMPTVSTLMLNEHDEDEAWFLYSWDIEGVYRESVPISGTDVRERQLLWRIDGEPWLLALAIHYSDGVVSAMRLSPYSLEASDGTTARHRLKLWRFKIAGNWSKVKTLEIEV